MGVYLWTENLEKVFDITSIPTYTNVYESWGTISNIVIEWTYAPWSSQWEQFYIRLHTAQSETNWMYGYVFDYISSGNKQWKLQYVVNNAWADQHTSSAWAVTSSNTYKITIWKTSWQIVFNGVTTDITYNSTEISAINTIFSSWNPYLYVAALWTPSSWTVKATVTYE